MSKKPPAAHRLRGLGYFCIVVAVLLLIFGVISPRFVANSSFHQQYGDLQDFLGIHSGRIQYTELETLQQTQDHMREGMKHVSKMKPPSK